MNFASKIEAFKEKAEDAADKAVSKVFINLGNSLVKLCGEMKIGGHSNGDLANNWHVSINAPNIVIPNGPDLSGAASLARIAFVGKASLFYRQDSKVFLTNVMNYAYRANIQGWPKGAGTNGWIWSGRVNNGYGFVGKAINNLKGGYM